MDLARRTALVRSQLRRRALRGLGRIRDLFLFLDLDQLLLDLFGRSLDVFDQDLALLGRLRMHDELVE